MEHGLNLNLVPGSNLRTWLDAKVCQVSVNKIKGVCMVWLCHYIICPLCHMQVYLFSEAAPPLHHTPCPALVPAAVSQVPGPGSVLRVPLVRSQPAHLNRDGVKTTPRAERDLRGKTWTNCQNWSLAPAASWDMWVSSELRPRHVQVKTINNTSSPVITTDQSRQVEALRSLKGGV